MSKRDRLMAEVGGNVEESTGGTATAAPPRAAAGPAPRPSRMMGVERSKDVAQIELGRLMPDPQQPRKEFGEKELDRLAESLKAKGQLQPIRVRWSQEASMYQIIMGERRYRAALRAGLPSLACVIHDGPIGPADVLAIQMVENVHRDDLKPVEQARAIERLKKEFGWNQQRVADELGMSQGAVAKTLALLKLAPEIQERVDSGKISKVAGQQIARVEPEAQAAVAAQVETGHLTEEETADVVKTAGPKRSRAGKGMAPRKKAAPKKPTSYAHNFDGIKIVATRGRGFTAAELRPAVASLLGRLDAEMGAVA